MDNVTPQPDPSPYVQLYIPRRQAEALLRFIDRDEPAVNRTIAALRRNVEKALA
jgi:hypothetical protein